ncbi:MAG TPA: carbohydrate porin [Acidobacteriaceae bacterium]
MRGLFVVTAAVLVSLPARAQQPALANSPLLAAAIEPQSAGGGNATRSLTRKPGADQASQPSEPPTMFPHPEGTPWYIAGQANIIFQAHPAFHSPYQGVNSLRRAGEYKTSLLGTLFLGYQLQRLPRRPETPRDQRFNTDFILDIESSGGRGLSQALGLAGFTNLDVVRNPNLGSKPYIAHAELHQTIGFTSEMTDVARGPLSLASRAPVRRLELRLGKMSLPDVFDISGVVSDSHLQFTNWTIDNNGAWDYAADTRGYTYAATAEYQDRAWAVRYGLALMPTVANGIDLDWALSRAKGQNFEFEWRHSLLPGREGTQRLLIFRNNAHMGSYREAVNAYLKGIDPRPTITAHEHFRAIKYGFGYNGEQQVTGHLRLAARFGWNEGQHESFAYTEVDQTVLVGGDYDGTEWSRPQDKAGLAFVSNAIKRDHQNYLADGGLGFLLGDGRLRYGRENTLESYYNLHAWRGLYFALALSHVDSPGYNHDRGPVWVPSVRAHVDF